MSNTFKFKVKKKKMEFTIRLKMYAEYETRICNLFDIYFELECTIKLIIIKSKYLKCVIKNVYKFYTHVG